MGTVVSKAANGIGGLLGNAFVAPFKTIFGRSCEDICSGTWDVTCFIEHICIGDLVKLLMVFGLCCIILMFFYLMFELGICQCIGKSLFKMCWASCKVYWTALEDITCFLWYKLKNVKRVNRRRQRQRRRLFQDIELGHSSSDESELLDVDRSSSVIRKRKLVKERRNDRTRSSLYPLRQGSKDGRGHQSRRHHRHRHRHRHHRARLKSTEGSVGGLKNSRQVQIRRLSKLQREAASFKRRRLE
ncbi:uncharacterized protein LOC132285080 [Cornus florida]|uniref:uncharacterized protein LOC132285080 n=1 Tax=Cornus florida TaxID=4283 RepID=UPI00289D3420|nr:uncharacterized protein LOC132285080 [Cornus florida]XP_059643231.1 uncharacterized protein LOC132285080 [Cornus florida]